MKKFILSLLTLIFILGLNGCGGIKYTVNSNIITHKQYSWEKYNIRVISVFTNNKENEKKVKKAIQNVMNSYKNFNSIKESTYNTYKGTNFQRLTCNSIIRARQELGNKIPNKCSDLDMFNKTEKNGNALKVYKKHNKIEFITVYHNKVYQSTARIVITYREDYIIVYIKDKPSSSYLVNNFIDLNNKIVAEFQKIGLKNQNKMIELPK